jgi:hypothetical protein
VPPSQDPCHAYGLKSGSKRRRKDEDKEKFLARIVKTCSKVIAQCLGDLPAVALVYGVDIELMEAVVASNRTTIGKVLTRAKAEQAARVHRSAEEAEAAKRLLMAEVRQDDKRLKRKSWPTDPEKRREDIHDALCVSLVENDGDIVEASLCLNVPIAEINEMMDGDEVLLSAREEGLRVQATKAESQAFKKAGMGDNAMIKLLLTNLSGDRWSERQQVDVRRVGFAPPEDKEDDVASVLQLVKGDKDNA